MHTRAHLSLRIILLGFLGLSAFVFITFIAIREGWKRQRVSLSNVLPLDSVVLFLRSSDHDRFVALATKVKDQFALPPLPQLEELNGELYELALARQATGERVWIAYADRRGTLPDLRFASTLSDPSVLSMFEEDYPTAQALEHSAAFATLNRTSADILLLARDSILWTSEPLDQIASSLLASFSHVGVRWDDPTRGVVVMQRSQAKAVRSGASRLLLSDPSSSLSLGFANLAGSWQELLTTLGEADANMQAGLKGIALAWLADFTGEPAAWEETFLPLFSGPTSISLANRHDGTYSYVIEGSTEHEELPRHVFDTLRLRQAAMGRTHNFLGERTRTDVASALSLPLLETEREGWKIVTATGSETLSLARSRAKYLLSNDEAAVELAIDRSLRPAHQAGHIVGEVETKWLWELMGNLPLLQSSGRTREMLEKIVTWTPRFRWSVDVQSDAVIVDWESKSS